MANQRKLFGATYLLALMLASMVVTTRPQPASASDFFIDQGSGTMLGTTYAEMYSIIHHPDPFSTAAASAYMVLTSLDNGIGAFTATPGEMLTWGEANTTPVSATFYDHYIEELDPPMLAGVLNHFKPHPSYNFGHATLATLEDAVVYIIASMAYHVPQAQEESGMASHVPAIIPLNGNYHNWAVVSGAVIDSNDFTPLGIWLLDPWEGSNEDPIFYTLNDALATDPITGTPAFRIEDIFLPMAEGSGTFSGQFIVVGQVIPEPVSLSMLIVGLLAIAPRRRKR